MSPEYKEIPIDQIVVSPFNTRGEIFQEEIASLAETMKSGNDVPIKVRPIYPKGKLVYEIVYGERRVKALKKARVTTARALVEDLTDEEVLMQQWNENEEHKDISDYGKALKLKQILDATNLSQAEVAAKLGKEQNWVSRHLSMLHLEQIIPRGIIHQLSEKQARVILSAPEELQSTVIDNVLEQYNTEKTLPSTTEIQTIINDLIKLSEEEEAPQPHEHVYDEGSTKCRICGRELTAPESVKAGIGPVCAGEKSADVSSTPERFPGEHEINQAMGIEPKPQTQEQRAYALLDDLHKRFGEPSVSFMNNQLMEKLHIYRPDSDKLIARYLEKRARAPTVPFKLVEVKEEDNHEKGITYRLCPICGHEGSSQSYINEKLDDMIDHIEEGLCTEGILPLGLAQKVAEYLRRRLQ